MNLPFANAIVARKTSGFWTLLGVAMVLGLLLTISAEIATAQSATSNDNYWDYTASGKLDRLLAADINADGVDEFVLSDAAGRLELLNSNGARVWSYSLGKPALALETVDSAEGDSRNILVGLRNELLMISPQGNLIWRVPLQPISTPATLLTNGGEETEADWLDEYEFLPSDIQTGILNGSSEPQILVLLQTGQLLRYNTLGERVWRHTQHSALSSNTPPQLSVADFDGDRRDEAMLAVFGPRRFSDLVYFNGDEISWQLPLSGRITSLSPVQFAEDEPALIAVGTNLGHVYLYDHNRNRIWFRTLNVPVTSLSPITIGDQRGLAVGTDAGTVTAFDQDGRRFWTTPLADNANRQVLYLTAPVNPSPSEQFVLGAVLEPLGDSNTSIDLMLLDENGQVAGKFGGVDAQSMTQFVDSNHDGNNELLLARFATLGLTGIGVGNRENAAEWEYILNAAPSAVITGDVNGDGEQEAIVGTRDGRVHALNPDRTLLWLFDTGGAIDHVELLAGSGDNSVNLLIAREAGANEATGVHSVLERRDTNGDILWKKSLTAPITALLYDEDTRLVGANLIVGTQDGRVLGLTPSGVLLWDTPIEGLDGGVGHLLLRPSTTLQETDLVVAGETRLMAVNPVAAEPSAVAQRLAEFEQPITGVYHLNQSSDVDDQVSLLVLVGDGTIHGLNGRGRELDGWPQAVNGIPTASKLIDNSSPAPLRQSSPSLLIGTNQGELTRLDLIENLPIVQWQVADLDSITSVNWQDTDADNRPDLALVGDASGEVRLYTQTQGRIPEQAFAPLKLDSSLFTLTTLPRPASELPDVLALTDNGQVQLFREQENRPPLLTNPYMQTDSQGISAEVTVNDVEQDNVIVTLELYDEANDQWLPQTAQTAVNGTSILRWDIATPPTSEDGLPYRFTFNDGFHTGTLTPPVGSAVRAPLPLLNFFPPLLFVLAGIFVLVVVFSLQQNRTPEARARRFYQYLKQEPVHMLDMLEEQYEETRGSADFLLNLASQARQANDRMIANLADGLFLLADRPQAGLSIMVRTLKEMRHLEPPLNGTERWYLTYRNLLALLEAPSITELSLQLPQFVQLLNLRDHWQTWAPELDALRPILSSIRDSERVDQVDDRLVYLNEASLRLRQFKDQLPDFDYTIERTAVIAVARRWKGLVSAEVDDLRGQAVLNVTLKTKRVVPHRHTEVALDILNNGRSPAENVIVTLDEDPAYETFSPPQTIPFLPPGFHREVRFTIEPTVADRLRLGVEVTFDDRNRTSKQIAFGDMISLLPPVRDFRPVDNPYMPGTPLRPHSMLFYGRDGLFDFIVENMTNAAQRNVLILVGQRRTGKTSAVLRLGEHLPNSLIPVYIDCQSLGVMPGIPSLMQELAWYIADAMALRDIEIEVPAIEFWEADPVHRFQREFLPKVKDQLPEGMRILLLFDEFETFEDMVKDGILPASFFPYLRHLMQHETRLGFVFVGTRRLEEMTSDYWSVLFNIALYRKIGYLDRDSAVQLITEPVAPNLIYDDLALDKILRVTAGHPYFLQLVCYTLVKQANQQHTGYVTISDVNEALNEMLSLGEVHFAYIWQRSSYAERALLTAVSHLMDRNVPFRPEELIEYLKPYDIHLDPAEVTAALTHLVERDIMREVHVAARTLYDLHLGLVGLWVAQNKSLSKLFEYHSEQRDPEPFPQQPKSGSTPREQVPSAD